MVKISTVNENEVFEQHLPLVKNIAWHYACNLPPEERDEVFSAATLGLVEAYNRYTHEKQTSFWTYAQNRVIGAIQDDLRKRDPLTRSQRKKVKTVERAFTEHTQVYGEQPKEEQLSVVTGMSIEDIRKAKTLKQAVQFISFEEYETRDDGSSASRIADHSAVEPEQAALDLEMRHTLLEMVDSLPEREKVVVELLYYSGKSPREVSDLLGVTEGRISQINKAAVDRLRKKASFI
ncbi:MAG: FliA/WhiG family RNA polymerase sigma factor [Deltaproteobacteria bacterium]|nr:FliA/WhiG family RNA polymerase sigma factor [Deltaproteobacteria bacterium]